MSTTLTDRFYVDERGYRYFDSMDGARDNFMPIGTTSISWSEGHGLDKIIPTSIDIMDAIQACNYWVRGLSMRSERAAMRNVKLLEDYLCL